MRARTCSDMGSGVRNRNAPSTASNRTLPVKAWRSRSAIPTAARTSPCVPVRMGTRTAATSDFISSLFGGFLVAQTERSCQIGEQRPGLGQLLGRGDAVEEIQQFL